MMEYLEVQDLIASLGFLQENGFGNFKNPIAILQVVAGTKEDGSELMTLESITEMIASLNSLGKNGFGNLTDEVKILSYVIGLGQ